MKEIEANKRAWAQLSREHYETFKKAYEAGEYALNAYIQEEVGDLKGKKLLHLQCNTGADSIALSRMGAQVLGVDLVPENIFYARKLAKELDASNVQFLESDIMELSEKLHETYDVVFTSEGVLGWLPDLGIWARTIRKLLRETGYLYVFDSHPFFLSFDEAKLSREEYEIRYPYFGREPDEDDCIGGYASEVKQGEKSYFWMHPVSEILNSLIGAGLHIEFFHEFPENFYDSGGMELLKEKRLYAYPYNREKYPISFSLKASVYRP